MIEPALILLYAAPVTLAALGELIAQKSGVINIGLEGMMLVGAFFGMIICTSTGSPVAGIFAGVMIGAVAGLISGWFCIKLAADQVVVGTAINLLALGLTSTLYRSRFGESGELMSLPKLPAVAGIDPVVVLAVLSVPTIFLLLRRTGWGLALRAAGEFPKGAEAAGFSVERLRLGAMVIGGAFAGLAGAHLCIGVAGSFAENMTNGRGFIAIAMVTFGRWRPLYVFFATLLIGGLDSLQYYVQAAGVQIPSQLMIAAPYLVALMVLIFIGKGSSAPAALGIAYRRSS